MNIAWIPRYIKKRAYQHARYYGARLKGQSRYWVSVGNIDIKLSFSTPYHHSIARSMSEGSWDELQLLPAWIEKAKQSSLIFDVGGFNGIYGILAAKANPNAKVVIFEPDPTNIEHIISNLALNSVDAYVVEAAVSDHDGTIKFSADGSTGSRITSWGVETRCVTLASFGSPELLKIDIEGHELEALKGADISKTKSIFIEENHTPLLEGFTRNKAVGLTAIYDR